MGVEREVGLDPDVTSLLAKQALQQTDGIYEYTESGGNFEALGMRLWDYWYNPFRGLAGTILEIEVEPSGDSSGSIISFGSEAARKGRNWGVGNRVYGKDEGLEQSFLEEFDAVLKHHQGSANLELEEASLRSSDKYTTRLGSRHRKLFALTTFGFITIFAIFLVPVSLATGAFTGGGSPIIAVLPLLLSVLAAWGLKRALGL